MPSNLECSVPKPLALVLHATRIVGSAPLRIVSTLDGWRVMVSAPFRVYSWFLLLGLHIMTVIGIVDDLKKEFKRIEKVTMLMSQLVRIIEIVIVMSTLTTCVVGATARMSKICACFNVIEKINSQTGISSPNARKETIKSVMVIIYLLIPTWHIVGYLLTYGLKIDSDESHNWLYFSYIIELVMIYSLQVQFVFIADHVNDTLKNINDSFEELVIYVYAQTTRMKNVNRHQIRHFMICFGATCDVVRQLDKCYSFGLTLLLLLFQMYSVVTPYYFITFTTTQYNGPAALLQIVYYIFHVFFLGLMCEPGHRVEQEMARTRIMISKLMCHVTSSKDLLFLELDCYQKQVDLNPISYSPSKLAKLTRSLMPALFIASTTLLVTVQEFRGIFKSKDDC